MLGACRRAAAGRFAALLCLACSLLGPPRASAEQLGPRPVTELERQAVALALDYCTRGPSSWVGRLDGDSWLGRLSPQEAETELAVRIGEGCVARWELQATDAELYPSLAVFRLEFPSGVEEALFLRLDADDQEPRILDVRIHAEPPQEVSQAADSSAEPAGATVGRTALGLLLLALLLLPAIPLQPRAAAARLLPVALLSCSPAATPPPEAAPEAASPSRRLGDLMDLRRTLTNSLTSPEWTEEQLAGLPAEVAPVARIWLAQHALLRAGPESAQQILESFPDLDPHPELHLLRARIAFLELQEVEAALSYERAMELLPVYEGLLFEAAEAALLLGYEDRGNGYLDRLREMGTRRAEVYYSLSRRALLSRNAERAVELFEIGWALQPMERQEVFEDPILAHLLDPGGSVFGLFSFDEPREVAVPSPSLGHRPLSLPPGVEARTSGSHLRLLVAGEPRLLIAGAAALAPPGTPVDRADAWRVEEERTALDGLTALVQETRRPGGLSRPKLRRRLAIAAEALARDNRWRDLLTLTETAGSQVGNVEPRVLHLRAEALRQTGRRDRATRLLAEMALDNQSGRRADPTTLFLLSDLLSKSGRFDAALRLAARANSQYPTLAGELHIDRIRMEQDLAAEFETTVTEHFEIRHPPGRQDLARRMGRILEAERDRLQRWIPFTSEDRIEVHLLRFGEFAKRYGGGVEVLGIFDGRIRLPLADVAWFHPFVVSLMTHELAHAMIAGYTRNQAPKWLHEGLAQHVEMVESRINPIADYRASRQLLSFPAVEGVLQGFPTAKLVATAYDEAVWTVHYVQSVHGDRSIRDLLDAFRQGASTEAALRRVFGQSVEEFDDALRAWWIEKAPSVWQTDVHEYEELGDRLVQRSAEADPDFLRLKWWQER